MRFLPVIDLMGGVVVRGVAGERERYQPLHSWLCPDANPTTLARAFVERLGFHDVYVADLDAIAGQSPAWSIYQQIADAGLRLWLDAGVGDVTRAAELAAWSFASRVFEGVLVGSESLRDIEQLPQIPSRQERRKVSVLSFSSFILMRASSTMGPQVAISISKVS